MPDWTRTDSGYVAADTAKDLRVRTGTSGTFSSLLNTLTAAQAGQNATFPYRQLPANPGNENTFGPLNPFQPQPLDPQQRGGNAGPRYREYPVGWNLELIPTPHIPFATLTEASRNIDMMRRCIELRKKEAAVRQWSFGVSTAAVNLAALREPARAKQDIRARLNKEFAEDIARANEFWAYPGRRQDYEWSAWLFAAMEQYLTIDAWCVYPEKTYGGDTLSLDIVDGATIKPLLDERGGKPLWPYPAYQQILYGLPRGDYTRTTITLDNGDVICPDSYTRDQLYYVRRHVRVDSPYGMSAVEQALISARLYLKRQGWMLSEYDDGTVPMAWLEAVLTGGEIEMTPQQRRQYEDALNDDLSGNTSARHRLKLLPPGFKAVETTSVDERYKPDYDLFLIKLLASHFDVPVSQLGFSEVKGLGSAGFHEGQSDNHERQATLPDLRWISEQITRISREQLGIRPELCHSFLGLEDEDEAAMDAIGEARVRSARATINEDRARRNEPLLDIPEADMPMIMTTRGVVFIDGASKLAPPGQMVEPAEYQPGIPGQAETAPQPPAPAKPAAQPKPPVDKAKAAELAAFRKWAAARRNPTRPFQFEHVTPEDAPDLADDPRVSWS